MALSDLISHLEQEAQSRVKAIQQGADAEVRALEAATEGAIADTTARHLEQQRTVRESVHRRERALARRQARARELEARHALISRVLEKARAIVSEAAGSPSYLEALPGRVDEVLSFLEGLRPRVRCQAAVAPLLQATIARHHGAELVIDELMGPGIVAEAADGSVIIDDTLTTRIARAESRLAIELSRKLGEGHA